MIYKSFYKKIEKVNVYRTPCFLSMSTDMDLSVYHWFIRFNKKEYLNLMRILYSRLRNLQLPEVDRNSQDMQSTCIWIVPPNAK